MPMTNCVTESAAAVVPVTTAIRSAIDPCLVEAARMSEPMTTASSSPATPSTKAYCAIA
jgi:hypothetical protein